ncbi:hypothetical protein GH714_039816 [Hevea brasiliensis]|uniref:Uncharacterized protein n=1 Tax=Hevea brasiliensis TaxID=3981 RepID=A0A6A6MG45_HEVBR|nr:hypothetical protein GH714_039816 [Hevea brasiliensis]
MWRFEMGGPHGEALHTQKTSIAVESSLSLDQVKRSGLARMPISICRRARMRSIADDGGANRCNTTLAPDVDCVGAYDVGADERAEQRSMIPACCGYVQLGVLMSDQLVRVLAVDFGCPL